ncbi:hypothetical protein [Winogradskyella flava]|uniref:Peptidase G2 IMC autoproteolytic cleavage domain-containing protein n=1 Tax=Winogradskyella flava TaxID=1884876 RepID=A0A842IV95_9FLAO|nr:hypothetical protein [Winogradskyella flava]MBC2846049.1 hypothetical protein [Winogradskyella flava]
MKKLLTLTFFICTMFQAMAQTDGITYQAVIIDPEALELPGVDVSDNFLPNTTIAIRFTIYDNGNQLEFQEVQITDTDDFGRINLLIGDAEHDYFKGISWDGTPKDLKVEIDFDAGNNFETMSRERLTFLPFAFHRNITATGTLTVDDKSFLNGELEVQGPTNLFSAMTVHDNNSTLLTGDLSVDGITNLNNALNVNGTQSATDLEGSLNVDGNTILNSNLDVLVGHTTLNSLTVNGQASFGDLTANYLVVNDSTRLQGKTVIDGMGNQIRLTSNKPNTGTEMANHPVLIDGGNNGLAIKVNGNRNNSTNFITFYDDNRANPWGRIEGETPDEFTNNADYNFDQLGLAYDIADGVLDGIFGGFGLYQATTGTAMAFTSATGCVGLGSCITLPIPSMIGKYTTETVVAAIQLVTAAGSLTLSIVNKATYDNNKMELQGVTYASGSGDYAEYLLREDEGEKMVYGDIVGVKGGKISKNLTGAERVMVVSYKPIVLGNMPAPNREDEYEKVAFMGQVPVNVFGKVHIGDYIIPGGKNNGIGVAVSPENIKSSDIKNIVGIAWEESNEGLSLKRINVAVGINANDNMHIVQGLENRLKEQQKEIDDLKDTVNTILKALSEGENIEGIQIAQSENEASHEDHNDRKYEILEADDTDIVYFEITKKDIEKVLVNIDDVMRDAGLYEGNKEVLKKLKTDTDFKDDFVDQIYNKVKKQIHYHKELDKGSRN